MIQLPVGCYLRSDDYEITLCTRRTRGRYDARGHYTTLSVALIGWRRKITRDIISREELQEMHDALSELRQLDEEARPIFKRVDLGGGLTGREAHPPRKTASEVDTAPPAVSEGDCTDAA